MRLLERERLLGRAVDPRFELAQLHGRVADGAGKGLPVNEGLGQRLGPLWRHLDVVAEHVVMAHLERAQASLAAIAGLQPADQAPAVVAKLHHLVERRIVAARDDAAVPDTGRRALHQGARQAVHEGLVMAECFERGRERWWRRMQALSAVSVEGIADRRNLSERVAHRGEVARPAAAEAEP